METYYIPLILGTAREERESEKVARYVLEQLNDAGLFETELLDVRDYVEVPHTIAPEQEKPVRIQTWKEKAIRADGYIIVSPEYNHGYPGELKLFLDHLYDEYERKPVAFCGVSNGNIGGARAVEMLNNVAITLGMVPIRGAVYFSRVEELFESNGAIKDKSYDKRLAKLCDNFMWYVRALKTGRSA